MHLERVTVDPIKIALPRLMEEQGLTETALAARTPYDQATINKYKRGRRGRVINQETVDTMTVIARAMNIAPRFFVEIRIWEARLGVEQAIREGLIDLDDLEELIESARLRREPRES